MEDIIKIVKSLEDSGLLLKGASKTINNEAIEQIRVFLSISLDAIGLILLGSISAGKGMNRAGEKFISAGYGPSIKSKNL